MEGVQKIFISTVSLYYLHLFLWLVLYYTELVKKFRSVLGVQHDDVLCSESQRVKEFLADTQILIQKFDSPAPSDLCFLQWLYNNQCWGRYFQKVTSYILLGKVTRYSYILLSGKSNSLQLHITLSKGN